MTRWLLTSAVAIGLAAPATEVPMATDPTLLGTPPAGYFARAAGSDLWWSLKRQPLALGSLAILVLIALAAAFAPWIAPQNPYDHAQLDLMDFELPPAWAAEGDAGFLLGTDNQGRDVLSAILYGSRISLVIGIGTMAVSMTAASCWATSCPTR